MYNFHTVINVRYVITLDKTGPLQWTEKRNFLPGTNAVRCASVTVAIIHFCTRWQKLVLGIFVKKKRWRMEELSFGRDIKDISACETVRCLDFRVIPIDQAWSQLSNRLPLFPVIMIYTQCRIDGRVHRMQCIPR